MIHNEVSLEMIQKLKILNNKLHNIQKKIIQEASNLDRILKAKLDDPKDELHLYEIDVIVSFEKNVKSEIGVESVELSLSNLAGLTYNNKRMEHVDWLLNENHNHECDESICDEPVSYLYHDIYSHAVFLPCEGIHRHLTPDEIVSFTHVSYEIKCNCRYWDKLDENIYGTTQSV